MEYYIFVIVDNFGGIINGMVRANNLKEAESEARAQADYIASLHRLPKSFYEVEEVKYA